MGKKKNSFLKKLALIMILVFVVALGIVSCTFLENKTLSVPKSVIQGKVEKKFPITKNLILFSLHIFIVSTISETSLMKQPVRSLERHSLIRV